MAVEEIDTVPAHPSNLAQAQPAVGADDDERSISTVYGLRESSNLTRREEAHFLRFEARRLDPVERVAHEDVVLDGGGERSSERPIHLVDGGRLQAAGGQTGKPGSQHRLVELAELHGTQLGEDMQPKVVEVDAPRRGPEVDEGCGPFGHPVSNRDASGSRVDPAPTVALSEQLAVIGLGGLAGPERPRALSAVRTACADLVADVPGRRGSPLDPHE